MLSLHLLLLCAIVSCMNIDYLLFSDPVLPIDELLNELQNAVPCSFCLGKCVFNCSIVIDIAKEPPSPLFKGYGLTKFGFLLSVLRNMRNLILYI